MIQSLKHFFSRKGNEKFLIDFLESLLETKIESIEIREEVNLEQLKNEEKKAEGQIYKPNQEMEQL